MSDPTLLMANRAGLPEHEPEAEPVLIQRDGDQVVLILDDGETLAFDATELRSAVDG
jgi:hypothetical protein